ncbi:class I adenylate-forming enzyme family protein [Streptomyces humi]
MSDQPLLADRFLRACAEHGDRLAVQDDRRSLTYHGLAEQVRKTARVLEETLTADRRRVAIHAHNSVDHVVAYYALLLAGRLPFLADAQFGPTELRHIADDCGIDAFLTDRPADFPLPARLRTVPGNRLALGLLDPGPAAGGRPASHPATATCRFTSGTTGRPKCLEFSHTAVLSAARSWTEGTGLTADDRVLCLAAFSNGLAFNTSLLPVLLAGAQLHLYSGLPTSAGIRRAVTRSGATRLVAFPLVYRLLAEAPQADPAGFATVTRAFSAASALGSEVKKAFEQRYGVPIADYYGIAETGPCTYERDPAHPTGQGSALPGADLRLRARPSGDPEILVRTASMATRYLNAPGLLEQRVDADGFYATGDTGRLGGGRLRITGRIAGPLNIAGRKIDPTEIEAVARRVPGVRDAVCFADRDARGEAVVHLVVATSRPSSRQEFLGICRSRLAAYKVPGRISFLRAIPRSSAGKVRLTELARLVAPAPAPAQPPAHDKDALR